MNWIQFCIVMAYASFALSCIPDWQDWFDVFLFLAGWGWLVAAVIIALH